MAVRISPTLAGMATYPFVRLEETRRRLSADGADVIDFGKGDPNEPTDPMIRQALVDALPERAPYPLAAGLPALREAVAGWCARRFGVEVAPDTELVPTYGVEDRVSFRVRGGAAGGDGGTEGLPPDRRGGAAGVRAARLRRRVERRATRRGDARALPGEARGAAARARREGLGGRRERGDHVPLGRRSERRERGRRRVAAARARADRLARHVLRPER